MERSLVYDRRYSDTPRTEDGEPLNELLPSQGDGIWSGNIGRDERGRFKLLDAGNYSFRGLRMDENFLPIIPPDSDGKGWAPCSALSADRLSQTVQISAEAFGFYLRAYARGTAPQTAV